MGEWWKWRYDGLSAFLCICDVPFEFLLTHHIPLKWRTTDMFPQGLKITSLLDGIEWTTAGKNLHDFARA